MARSKGTPVQRTPSSEYVSKTDRTSQHAGELSAQANGKIDGKSDAVQAVKLTAKKEAGVVTLIIDVVGIYASL